MDVAVHTMKKACIVACFMLLVVLLPALGADQKRIETLEAQLKEHPDDTELWHCLPYIGL